MATRKDLENLLAIILVIFFIIMCLYAIKSLDNEKLLVLDNDASWISITFAFIIIFLSFEGVHENNIIIILIGAIIIIISTMLFLAISRTSPSYSTTNDDNNNDITTNITYDEDI